MAENNMINLKVFLRDDTISEARRFTVDASVVTSFIFMKEKLQTVFPVLRDADFKITWKDMDGDEITIASDEDFITAFTEMSSSVKILYVTIIQRNPEATIFVEADGQDERYAPFRGPKIICDICNQIITGYRYKCLQCPDYDLCGTCEHQGHHSEHLMMRVPNTESYMPKCTRKFMHHVARNLKKSAYFASKEAHRAAKFASKFGTAGKSAGEENKNENPATEPQPGGSNKTNQEPSGCPFAAAGAGPINMNDVHALGAMARQHFGPLLGMFNEGSQQQFAAENNNDQGGLFMDMLRNAVDGFFGRVPDNETNNQQEKEKQQTEKQQTDKQQTEKEQPNTQTNDNGQNNSETQSTPMETEAPAPQGSNVTFAANSSPQQPDNNQRRDPGWTFVATNQSQTSENTTNAATENQPTAPTFVYHENPRIAEGLVQLHEMGFSNESGFLTLLLERFDGNVAAVVKTIVEMKV